VSRLRPEAVCRWLDDMDAVAYALPLFWHGAPALFLRRTLILVLTALALALGPTPGG
jgi:hypothetical protein